MQSKDKKSKQHQPFSGYDKSLELRQLIRVVLLSALVITIGETAAYVFFFA